MHTDLDEQPTRAERTLQRGVEHPYHGKTPSDWAEAAVCAVLYDLNGRGAISDALDQVDGAVREQIVVALADCIRVAGQRQQNLESQPVAEVWECHVNGDHEVTWLVDEPPAAGTKLFLGQAQTGEVTGCDPKCSNLALSREPFGYLLDLGDDLGERFVKAAEVAPEHLMRANPETIVSLFTASQADAETPPLIETTPSSWRCFHCDEVFHDAASASLHFGQYNLHQCDKPACQYDVAALREAEETARRYAAEDSDLHRTIYGMRNRHFTELRRAEEAGYARALKDTGYTLLPDSASQRPELTVLCSAYKSQRDSLLDFIQKSPVSSGVCCCGESMDSHGDAMDTGHLPADQWAHFVDCITKELANFDSRQSATVPSDSENQPTDTEAPTSAVESATSQVDAQ